MQMNLTGKNIDITPTLRTRAEEKFESLTKRFGELTNIHLVLHIESHHQCAEATVHFHGNELHATAKTDDMYTSIDQVEEKLSHQMQKYKEKLIDSHRQSS